MPILASPEQVGVNRRRGSASDGATFWRKRMFRRGENTALENARDLVAKLLADRAKIAGAEAKAFDREMSKPVCA